MALNIYPASDYDSFVSVADATLYIEDLTLFASQWGALTTSEKEVYLRIAFRDIDNHVDQDLTPYPDPMPDCVAEAQALMAVQDVVYGFSASTQAQETGAIKRQKVSSLEIEYYDTPTGSVKTAPKIPAMVRPCLEELGYVFEPSVTGLSQTTLGRS